MFFKYDEDLWGTCTNWTNWGCYRTSSGQEILPSIMSGNVTSHASIKYWRVNWDQEFKKETGFGQVCKNRIITPSGKKKLCNNNLTLLFVISTFLNSYIGMLTGEKINYDTWSISGEIYIIESKGTCTCFYFMFVPHSLCNI